MSIQKCFLQCHRKVQSVPKKSGLKIVRIEEKCCKYHVHEMLNLNFSHCVIREIGGVLLEDIASLQKDTAERRSPIPECDPQRMDHLPKGCRSECKHLC